VYFNELLRDRGHEGVPSSFRKADMICGVVGHTKGLRRAIAFISVLPLMTGVLEAQWPLHPTPGVPWAADGGPDLDAPPPRGADGKPDFSGLWRVGVPGGREQIAPPRAYDPPRANGGNIGTGWGGPPLTVWGEEEFRRRRAQDTTGPRGDCLPLGVVQFHTGGGPRKFIHTPNVLVILYEFSGGVRQIFTDGRTVPTNDPQPWWYGYSAGRWEGDTLVVETGGLRDGAWLDTNGSPLTAQAKLTERIRRPTYWRMEIDITVEDPKAYTKPWTVRVNQQLTPDEELIEFVCLENQKYGKPR